MHAPQFFKRKTFPPFVFFIQDIEITHIKDNMSQMYHETYPSQMFGDYLENSILLFKKRKKDPKTEYFIYWWKLWSFKD